MRRVGNCGWLFERTISTVPQQEVGLTDYRDCSTSCRQLPNKDELKRILERLGSDEPIG